MSELCNTRLSDCQERKDAVIIRVIGKGNKEGFFFMSIDLFQEIKQAYRGKTYLFECKGKAMSRMTVYTLIKRAGSKIGRPDIHPHTLRHSWASLSIDVLGLAKVSGYLRHASQDTTDKYYLHGKAEMLEILAVNTLKLGA